MILTLISNATIKSLLQKCKSLKQLKELHAHILKFSLEENPLIMGPLLSSAVISKYISCFSYTQSIFHNLCRRNTFMYNTMLRAYMQSSSPLNSVLCYLDMLGSGIAGNNYTFPPLIKACTLMGSESMLLGRLVHAHVAKFGFSDDPFIISSLIEFYCIFDLDTARRLFNRSNNRDVVMWTALIDGYGKAWDLESARELFEKMPERNVISWSAMIAAYSRVGNFKEVLLLFSRMQEEYITPNESVLVSVLTACAHLGAITQGFWVHSYAKRLKFDSNHILATALIDMYAKCGFVDLSLSVFDNMPFKDAGAWNALISGFALSGYARKSLELFNEMVSSGTQPTETTFVLLLTACTHAGLISEGLKLFEEMGSLYSIEPRMEHLACVVDLVARSGLVSEAEEFVEKNMGGVEGGDANVWGALLGACRVHGNVELGNRIWRRLADMGINDYGSHILSYNMYREAGWEDEAKRVRKLISDGGMSKKPGCSVIELNGIVEEFLAGDFRHTKAEEIYRLLNSFSRVVSLEEVHTS
ncbi:hypothetical protein SAY87_009397 [Trapa incisa]|uniref:Pentatricopeptide repeat-containing protein At5g66520-like n=1 Tax=Trapa incisa TaxID=236973 RepID=A0AAN7JUW7_9MYRT|nr:hypothetical protein SAY87_009397 [Trapa incisa]